MISRGINFGRTIQLRGGNHFILGASLYRPVKQNVPQQVAGRALDRLGFYDTFTYTFEIESIESGMTLRGRTSTNPTDYQHFISTSWETGLEIR